ncbi:hypothetical protein [Alicyclobacillus sp. SP_1]|uniref:hypothetical protein n=1 Tax=Alicyclobacillus sp. SP_1 TaxID=2942475 RepID=UPI0021588E74|nr:hypothetical protein [Alicyclobacillus sp. SP_1]
MPQLIDHARRGNQVVEGIFTGEAAESMRLLFLVRREWSLSLTNTILCRHQKV